MKDIHLDPKILAIPGQKHLVDKFETSYTAGLKSKKEAQASLSDNIKKMTILQDKLYAQNRHSLLIIFQAMDAAGKDGTIKHVMSGVNPQGTQVFSFKVPSALELDHDYLWRTYKRLPERGRIGIFNRSYYEEMLVVRVHPEYLLKQQLPTIRSLKDIDEEFWQRRFHQINKMEQHLTENGTQVIKFFLNISHQEQKKRFLKRIDDPSRNWKFSMGDVEERQHWNQYMHAYSEVLNHSSTPHAPWYVIPADKKWFMRLAVSNIIVNRLNQLDLHYPKLPASELANLLEARKRLKEEPRTPIN
jgi:PPK2 family polyphosphate:nucleotide phosphotransferase